MQKKFIALAVAAAFSAPAFAENANVTWYGKLFLNVESVSNDKVIGTVAAPNETSLTRVQTNASRLGVQGKEDLGGGLSGIYQLEVQVDANGAGGAGASGFGNGTRNSGVGLESAALGKVIVGVWDTPFKVAHNKIELFDNTTSFTSLNLIGRANGGAATGKNYNTRQASVIEYWTPKFGAVQGAISYTPDSTALNAADNSRLSLSATYDVDAVYASAAYESRADGTTAGAGTVAGKADSALRFVGKYTLGDIWVGGALERLTVHKTATISYTQTNFELVGQYQTGAHKVAASFAKAGKTDIASTGASQLTLRYGYDFSKRTEVFAAYTSLSNDAVSAVVAGSGGTYGLWGFDAGSKQSAFGAGVIHSF